MKENEDLELLQIFIEPPEPAVHSDEDSRDEDAGARINNISGRQLSAPCEVILAKGSRQHRTCCQRTRYASPPETVSARDNSIRSGIRASRGRGRVSSRSRRRGRSNISSARAKVSSSSTSADDSDNSDVVESARKKTKSVRAWVKEDLSKSLLTFPDGDYSSYRGKSPLEMLEIFWGGVIKLLVDQSTKYAASLNCPNPNITHDEMKVFIAILIISGYNTIPSKNRYWDQGSDMRNEMIYAMRRDRFKTILRFLHCADNTQIDMADKMWKRKPLVDLLQKTFQLWCRITR